MSGWFGEAIKDEFREVDHQTLKSAPSRPWWNNTAQWARNTMVSDGLLKKDAPHGVWEMSEDGRKHLKANSKPA